MRPEEWTTEKNKTNRKEKNDFLLPIAPIGDVANVASGICYQNRAIGIYKTPIITIIIRIIQISSWFLDQESLKNLCPVSKK